MASIGDGGALTPVVAEITWSDGADECTGSFEGGTVELFADAAGEWRVRIDGRPAGTAASREAAKALAAERVAADRLQRSVEAQIG
jgi:hypothetical protein